MLAGPKIDLASVLRSVFCEAAAAAAEATETAAHLSEPASEPRCYQGLFVQRQSQRRVILFVIVLPALCPRCKRLQVCGAPLY